MVDLINALGIGILYTGIVIMLVTVVTYVGILTYVWIKNRIDDKKEE